MRHRNIFIFLLVASFLGGSLEASDSHMGIRGIQKENPMLRKLGRGFSNVLFGAGELPIKMSDVGQENGPLAGITYGVVKGVGAGALRMVAGAVEMLTFPLPFPRGDYESLIQPEFLLEPR